MRNQQSFHLKANSQGKNHVTSDMLNQKINIAFLNELINLKSQFLVLIIIFQFQVRQAGQITTERLYELMDDQKIHDTRLQNRNHKSFLGFLTKKSRTNPLKRTESIQTSISVDCSSRTTPKYSFRIVKYEIAQHVEYVVEMQESFKILGRKIHSTIQFRTRYSMLQKLNQKVLRPSFPPKKFFGNKGKKFVAERKKQLEHYLNEISVQRSAEFLKFVKQIKETDFNRELKRKFKLN